MKKIPSLFVYDIPAGCHGKALYTREVTPGCEWVFEESGEIRATRKWDGTCCLVREGRLYKRYDAKHGKIPPPGFDPAQDPDPKTGHWPGWVLVGDEPESKYHREAFDKQNVWEDGTYELVGPKINGNNEKLQEHILIRHGIDIVDCPRAFDALRNWLSTQDVEGVVFYGNDNKMCKAKKSGFDLLRRPNAEAKEQRY